MMPLGEWYDETQSQEDRNVSGESRSDDNGGNYDAGEVAHPQVIDDG